MSGQNTIVERASAELTKRINGLRKHGSSSSSNSISGNNSNSIVSKTVMERVTNVLCGGSHNNNNSTNNSSNSSINNTCGTPEKPHRFQSKNHHNLYAQHGKMSGLSNNVIVVGSAYQNSSNNSNSIQSTPQSLRKYHMHCGLT